MHSESNLQMNTTITLVGLLLGAVGALSAIYLKEAVQQAILRRTLAWQLFGYLQVMKRQILRNDLLYQVYDKVKLREAELQTSLEGGTELFSQKWRAQNNSREELQKILLDALNPKLIPFTEGSNPGQALQEAGILIASFQPLLAQHRRDLVDGKMFLSDRDAAQLGRRVALNAIQFKGSLQTLLACFEQLPAAIKSEEGMRSALLKMLIDQFVVQGEDFLEALVRLERATDRITRQSLLRHTWEVLASA